MPIPRLPDCGWSRRGNHPKIIEADLVTPSDIAL